MNMTFEDFVKDAIDKDEYMANFWKYTYATENMLNYISSQHNRSFIYNYEDDKCYYFYNDKLYRLSVNFEEVDIWMKLRGLRYEW